MLNQGIYRSFKKGIATIRMEKGVHVVYDRESGNEKGVAPVLATVRADTFLVHPQLHQEIFGPFSLLVLCQNAEQMKQVAEAIEGQLTATLHMHSHDTDDAKVLVDVLIGKAGRIIINGVPTGLEVCAAMTHGGPYPASTDSRFTAVGHHSIRRWVRPVTFQNFPDSLLPQPLRE
jgi:NADP-dependent aldehyde dehydrogenase